MSSKQSVNSFYKPSDKEGGRSTNEYAKCPRCKTHLLDFEVEPLTSILVEVCDGCGYRAKIMPKRVSQLLAEASALAKPRRRPNGSSNSRPPRDLP